MTKQSAWKCKQCGTINKSYYLNCMNCASYQRNQKKKHQQLYSAHSSSY